MARRVRVQYPGAVYHVMNRGDHQERIFQDDDDRRQFLSTLAECCEKTGWQIHAFCLMSGSEQFRADMLEYIERQRGKWHYGSELCESSQAKAEHLIGEALRNEGIPDEQLGLWRKGRPFKIKLAARLRAQSTGLPKRLRMGTRGHLAHLIYLHEHAHSENQSSAQLGFRR